MNEDILDAIDRLTKAVDTLNLQPRRRYHYATLPAEDVCQSARVCTIPDSYISDDPISAAHLDGHRPRRPQLRAFDDLQQPSLTQ